MKIAGLAVPESVPPQLIAGLPNVARCAPVGLVARTASKQRDPPEIRPAQPLDERGGPQIRQLRQGKKTIPASRTL
jgi:hypothetical protein